MTDVIRRLRELLAHRERLEKYIAENQDTEEAALATHDLSTIEHGLRVAAVNALPDLLAVLDAAGRAQILVPHDYRGDDCVDVSGGCRACVLQAALARFNQEAEVT